MEASYARDKFEPGLLMIRVIVLVVAVLAMSTGIASAADLHDPNNTFSDLLELVRNNASVWSVRLRSFAVQIFWWLAGIQLVLTMAPLVARGPSIRDSFEVAMFIFKTGVFYSLMIYSVTFGEAIVNSFRHVGAAAAGVPIQINPGDMFSLAVSFANTVSDVDTLNPATGIGIMFSAIVVLVCFVFIATLMAVTLMESYFVINAAMLFMGFGGAEFTREYAISMMKYAIAVGAKLFVITLIVGLIMSSGREWQASYHHDSVSTWTLVGLAFMCAIFTKTIMDRVESLITGVSPGGGAVIGGMAAAGMAFGAAAAATISSKMASMGVMSGGSGGVSNLMGMGSGAASSAMNAMSGGSSSGNAPRSTPPSSGGMNFKQKMAHAAHAATSGAVRMSGFVNSISVPGMEGAEQTSIGPSPIGPGSSDAPSASDTPENVIRPDLDTPPGETK